MNEIAETIYQQLGGNRFRAMTGAKNFVAAENSLSMTLPKNKSGANALEITLGWDDLYTMRFYRFSRGRFNSRTLEVSPPTYKNISVIDGIYWDALRSAFERVTGFYTSL